MISSNLPLCAFLSLFLSTSSSILLAQTTDSSQQPTSLPNRPQSPLVISEIPPVLKASETLRPEIIKGKHYNIRENISTSGFLNHYTIDSNYGTFQIDGNALLAKRIREIKAISVIDKIEKSDEFTKALAKTAKMPLQMMEHLIDDPRATAQQIGQGAKRLVNRAGELFQRKGKKTKEEDNAFQSALGFSKVKRKICWDLQVDPYTTNQVLQDKLDKLAWASFAGEFTIRLGMLAIPGGAGSIISGAETSSSVAETVRDNSPIDLSAKNRNALLAMGVNEQLTNAFLETNDISPTQQTAITSHLADLKNAQGRATYIGMCLSARSEADAIFYERISQLMTIYSHKKSPIIQIFKLYGLPAAYTENQTLVIPLELDYGSWTPQAARLAHAIASYQLQGKPILHRHLVITGKLSPMARAELAKLGITTIENVLDEGIYAAKK